VAEIHVEADALAATATALLALADDVNDVAFTHGPNGSMFIVPDELAEKLFASSKTASTPVPVKADVPAKPAAEAPKPASDGAPPAPKAETRRLVNPRAKSTDQE
jgi:hypothetical protein